MANGNGNGKKQYIGIAGALLLAGGGGGVIGANTHDHPPNPVHEERIDEIDRNQAAIRGDVGHIKDDVERIERTNNEAHEKLGKKLDDILEEVRR